MMMKKKVYLSRLLLVCGALLIIFVASFAFKDLSLSPAERFEKGMYYMAENDYKKAEKYYILAVNSDDKNITPLANYYLGKLYLKNDVNFKGNGKRAEKYLLTAANLNLAQAQYDLALMYDIGDKIPENRKKAISFMQKAVNQDYVDALYSYGVWIERGYFGTPDMKKVLDLYEKAADKNHLHAMTSLIAIYFGGYDNIPADKEKANYWMDRVSKIYQK